jgi:DNA-3-methyladenine glycosylase
MSAFMRRLSRGELPIDTVALAKFLLGCVLVHDLPEGRVSGRIVETEAYVCDDPASHAYRGRTVRNASMFLERGHAYVYCIYGSSYCLNVSSEHSEIGAAVLLRALEPLEGIALMERLRGTERLRDLTRGPGRLVQALGVNRTHDGLDLCASGSLRLGGAVLAPGEVGESVRIGITRETERILRFYERGNAHVSGPTRLNA